MRENRELCAVCRNDLEECIDEHPSLSLIPEPPAPHPDTVEIDELTLFIINSLNSDPEYLLRTIQEASDTDSTQQEDQWWLDDDDMEEVDSVS